MRPFFLDFSGSRFGFSFVIYVRKACTGRLFFEFNQLLFKIKNHEV